MIRVTLSSFLMQVSVLAGDFLLSRACVALAALKVPEVCVCDVDAIGTVNNCL